METCVCTFLVQDKDHDLASMKKESGHQQQFIEEQQRVISEQQRAIETLKKQQRDLAQDVETARVAVSATQYTHLSSFIVAIYLRVCRYILAGGTHECFQPVPCSVVPIISLNMLIHCRLPATKRTLKRSGVTELGQLGR